MHRLQQFKADIESSRFVYSYILMHSDDYERYTIFPDGCDYMVFSSSQTYAIYTKQKIFQSIEIYAESVVILRLKPYTLTLLQQKDFIFKSQALSLSKEIFKTKSILKQMELSYNILFSDITLNKKIPNIIRAVDLIYSSKGDIKVDTLSTELHCTNRTLQRWFKEYILLTPKEYISIIRLQADIRKIKKIEFLKTHNISDSYTDYSHFYKAFKKFTNLSPKVYYLSELPHIRSIYDIY